MNPSRLRLTALLVLFLPAAAQPRGAGPAPEWRGVDEARKLPGQFVFLTHLRDSLVVLLPGDQRRPPIFVSLHNQLRPKVTAAFRESSTHTYSYEYTVANLTGARDTIGQWLVVIPAAPFPIEFDYRPAPGQVTWHCSPTGNPIAIQAELTGTPKGRYAFCLPPSDADGIAPGAVSGKFVMKSAYSPGFTTAFAASIVPLNLPQEWPNEVFAQLNFIEGPNWTDRSVLTWGPVFPPGSSPRDVAANFALGIVRLEQTGALDSHSEFISDVRAALSAIQSDRRSGVRPAHAPGTAIERQIASALSLSLDPDHAQR